MQRPRGKPQHENKMKKHVQTVEDYKKNLPAIKMPEEVSADFEVMDFSELEMVEGGKGGRGSFGFFCNCGAKDQTEKLQ